MKLSAGGRKIYEHLTGKSNSINIVSARNYQVTNLPEVIEELREKRGGVLELLETSPGHFVDVWEEL